MYTYVHVSFTYLLSTWFIELAGLLQAPCHAIHQERTLRLLGMWDEMLSYDIPRGGVWKDCSTWGEGIYIM